MKINANIFNSIHALTDKSYENLKSGDAQIASEAALAQAAEHDGTDMPHNGVHPKLSGRDAQFARIPLDMRDAARALLEYQTPATAENLGKLISYILPSMGFDIEGAALLVSDGIGVAPEDIGLLSDIINGRYNIANELNELVNLYLAEARTDGAAALRELTAVQAVIDALSQFSLSGYRAEGIGAHPDANVLYELLSKPQMTVMDETVERLLSALLATARYAVEKFETDNIHTKIPLQHIIDSTAADKYRTGDLAPGNTDSMAYVNNINTAPPVNSMLGASADAHMTNAAVPGFEENGMQTGLAMNGAQAGRDMNTVPIGLEADAAQVTRDSYITQITQSMSNATGFTDFSVIEDLLISTFLSSQDIMRNSAAIQPDGVQSAGFENGLNDKLNDKITELFHNNLYISPTAILSNPAAAPEVIRAQYEIILMQINLLRASIKTRPQQPSAKSLISDKLNLLEDGVRLIQSLNNRHQYVQIPLHITGHDTNLELYMMNRGGKKKKINHEDATLFLSLNTKNIGRVEALIHIGKNKRVGVDLRVENERALTLMKDGRLELHSSLGEKGYRLARITYHIIETRISATTAIKHVNTLFPPKLTKVDYRI
jgi:hypothetical protein